MAHSAAIASDMVRADMVESIEFPHLANKYQVYGVPRTIYNEDTYMEGAAPEYLFVAKLQQAAGLMTEADVEALFSDATTQVQALDESEDE